MTPEPAKESARLVTWRNVANIALGALFVLIPVYFLVLPLDPSVHLEDLDRAIERHLEAHRQDISQLQEALGELRQESAAHGDLLIEHRRYVHPGGVTQRELVLLRARFRRLESQLDTLHTHLMGFQGSGVYPRGLPGGDREQP